MERGQNERIVTFWQWFFCGAEKNGKPGCRKLLDRWIAFDILIGIFFASIVEKNLSEVSGAVLFPLAGVFIGISLTWGGAAQALLDSNELRFFGENHERGYAEYPYSFQSAVLVIFTALGMWGIASLGVLEKEVVVKFSRLYFVIGILLYGVISTSLRTCWRMVSFSHELLLVKEKIIKMKANAQDNLYQLPK